MFGQMSSRPLDIHFYLTHGKNLHASSNCIGDVISVPLVYLKVFMYTLYFMSAGCLPPVIGLSSSRDRMHLTGLLYLRLKNYFTVVAHTF